MEITDLIRMRGVNMLMGLVSEYTIQKHTLKLSVKTVIDLYRREERSNEFHMSKIVRYKHANTLKPLYG